MHGSLPRPYDLKPRRGGRDARLFFTTPMKKLMGYLVLFGLVALVIYTFGPSRDVETEFAVVRGAANEGRVADAKLDAAVEPEVVIDALQGVS